MVTWYTLAELSRMSGLDQYDLELAVEKRELLVAPFGPQGAIRKTTDEEFIRWSRHKLYSRNKIKFEEISRLNLTFHDKLNILEERYLNDNTDTAGRNNTGRP